MSSLSFLLMVFEEYDRALEHVRHALKRFPRNAQLREMRVVIERRLR